MKTFAERVAERRANETEAEKAHRAQLRAESDAVGRRMAADPRYCAETPEEREVAWAEYRARMGDD
jgi:hypothetical protein